MPSLALAEASSVKCCFYIKNHPQLRKLEVNGAWISSKTLKKIAGLRHLQELKLVQVDNSDVRLLQPLSDLKRLELGGNWQHFEALKNFEDLESFAIEGGEPSLPKEEIYKLLHSLPENLHELQIIGMPTLDEEALAIIGHRFCDLHTLVLTGSAHITSLQFLMPLKQLRRLEIGSFWCLRDISACKELLNLKEVSFSGCSAIDDFAVLKDIKTLETLNLCGCFTDKDETGQQKYLCREDLPRESSFQKLILSRFDICEREIFQEYEKKLQIIEE